jgi:ribosomal protein S18 acetylase RimI-like enzyme
MTILRNTPEFLPHEVTVAEELIDAYLSSPESGYYILVAEDGGRVAGYVCYGNTPLTEATWDIYWVAVDNSLRGKGTGKALMTGAETSIKSMHGKLMVIETSGKPQYDKTRRFHISLGYNEIARIPDYYTAGDDLVILVKRLQ